MTTIHATFPTIELVRFLIARIDEEDQVLRALVRRSRRAATGADDRLLDRSRIDIIAKRQILGHVQHLLVLHDLPEEKTVRDLATQILRAMAMPYGAHSMFRSEWHKSA